MNTSLPLTGILASTALAASVFVATAADEPRLINFSGIQWRVKSSTERVGPGSNYFSNSQTNVWIDPRGRLHLAIVPQGDKWTCAEVVSQKSFGHGTYRFVLDSPVDRLDPNVVFGLFTWKDEPAFNHREIDIEFSRWQSATNQNAQFVIQPYTSKGNMARFDLPPDLVPTSHIFTWKSNAVDFLSWPGAKPAPARLTEVIRSWSYTGPDIPKPGGENLRLNLWLIGGKAPTDARETEVIIRRVEFKPLP